MATKRSPLRATLHDVAREAGVSIATASRALNGSDRVVGAEIATRVRDAAQKLRYVPTVPAQSVKRGASSTIGLIVNSISDPYFAAIASGLIAAAKESRMTVTVALSDGRPDRELEAVREMRGHGHRAIVIAGTRTSGTDYDGLVAQLQAFRGTGGNVVMLSQSLLPFPSITVDNVGGARGLALKLAGHGYRRFAVLSGPLSLLTVAERTRGFTEGLAQVGLGIADGDVFIDEFTRDGGYAAAQSLLRRGIGDIDLVFALNDVMAVGAAAAFRDHGIQVGVDLGLAGFDDVRLARDVTPSLTTVSVPLNDIGSLAFSMAADDPADTDIRRMPATSVIRDSTPRRTPRSRRTG